MKKISTVLLMIFAITAGSFSTASAMDFLIGAKGGYFVWDPYLKRSGSPMFESMENGNGQLYGPVFSALFTSDLSLSVSGLFGQQSANWIEKDFTQSATSTNLKSASYAMDVKRIDVDTALSLRLTDNFKLIAGYKYQLFDMKIEDVHFERNASTGIETGGYNKNDIKMPFHGPAVGVGFSSPIGEKFFFAGNFSALYMWGKFDFDSLEYYYNDSTGAKQFSTGGGDMSGVTMRTRGINCEPTIGASIGEGLPIVTFGIRFQWSQTKFYDMPSDSGMDDKWNNDYQYGLFVGVVQPI